MANITVYPNKPSALLLVHPTHGKISTDGSIWPRDGQTSRWLTAGFITDVKPIVAAHAPTKSSSNDTAKA